MNELTPWEGIGNRSVRTDRLAARGRETLGLLRKLGIDVQPNNRIDRAAKLLDEVDRNIRRGIDISPQDIVRQATMVEAQRTLIDAVTIVHARISRPTGAATIGRDHLKALLTGPDLPSAAGDRSRSFQFEARVGALLVFAGLAVRRGEPDFVFEMGGFPLGVAVKRMTSSGAAALAKRVREGVSQLAAARMHGFIAIDVDSWQADELGGLEATDFGIQFERELAAARDVVNQSSFNERVIGAMLFASRSRFDFSGPKSTFDARIGQQIVLLDDSPGVVAWASELIVGMQARINAGIAEVGRLIEA